MAKFTQRSQSKTPDSRRNLWLIVLLILLLCIGGAIAYFSLHNKNPATDSTQKQQISKTQSTKKTSTNLEAPTDAEKNAARDNTPAPQPPSTNTSGKQGVTPTITSVNKNETRAFIAGVIEDGGTCTATYTHGGDVITATSTGISDVNHTTCPPMTLSGPINIQGDWLVVVTYSSTNYYGKSQPSSFKVN